MKLSHMVLLAVSTAVLSASCNKGNEPKPQQTPVENQNHNENGEQPDYCPACGMG